MHGVSRGRLQHLVQKPISSRFASSGLLVSSDHELGKRSNDLIEFYDARKNDSDNE